MKTGLVLLILCSLALPAAAQVKFNQQPGAIEVIVAGKPFTAFYAGGEAPKPYLHPLTTATGKRISRNYPMEQTPGETKDHPHHRGLWFTHGDVNGFDFWVNEKTDNAAAKAKRGIIVLKSIDEVKENVGKNKDGRIKATFEWQSPTGEPLLTETRTMTFVNDPTLRIIDFDVTFKALTKVKFGDTKEGFFAIRLRDEMAEKKGTGKLTSAEGATGMKDVWGKRSPWVDYSGTVEGEAVGVAILDHPSNPKHPTYWHARDYGLFAANQFGEHDFLNDKTKDGGLALEPGQSLQFRYEVVIHPGDTATAKVADLYKKYTAKK